MPSLTPHAILEIGGGREVLLVPAHDVVPIADLQFARQLVAAASGEAGSQLRELARTSGLIDEFAREEDVLEALAQMLASGEYKAVIIQEACGDTSGIDVLGRDGEWEQATRLADLAGPDAPARLHTLGLSLLDRTGIPYAGLELRLVHGNGSRERIVLDAVGQWHGEDVPGPGPTRVELPAELALTESQQRGRAVEGFVLAGGDIVIERRPAGDVSLTVLDREYRLIVRGGRRVFSS